MSEYLEGEIIRLIESGTGLAMGGHLCWLLSDNREPEIIRNWIKKNRRTDGIYTPFYNARYNPKSKEFEHSLIDLAWILSREFEVSLWYEKTGEEKKEHYSEVAKKARELARLIGSSSAPKHPSPSFFHDDTNLPGNKQKLESLLTNLVGYVEYESSHLPLNTHNKDASSTARRYARSIANSFFLHVYGKRPFRVIGLCIGRKLRIEPPSYGDVRGWLR